MIHSDKGYSILEVLISASLGTLVLAGVFDVYIASTKNLTGQANIVHMQADAKTAMDYIVRELRMGATTYAALDTSQPNTIKFARAEEYGYSSSNTNATTTLMDSSKAWAVNKFAGGTYFVWIKSGTGVGEFHGIQSNTSNTLTLKLGETWGVIPNTTSLYFIVRKKAFTWLAADQTARFSNNDGGTYNLLARNVTALSFSQVPPCPAASVCITLSARSNNPDPNSGQYRTYTLTDTANPRN
jgi:Tfp pilus assembly protein PilW